MKQFNKSLASEEESLILFCNESEREITDKAASLHAIKSCEGEESSLRSFLSRQ